MDPKRIFRNWFEVGGKDQILPSQGLNHATEKRKRIGMFWVWTMRSHDYPRQTLSFRLIRLLCGMKIGHEFYPNLRTIKRGFFWNSKEIKKTFIHKHIIIDISIPWILKKEEENTRRLFKNCWRYSRVQKLFAVVLFTIETRVIYYVQMVFRC